MLPEIRKGVNLKIEHFPTKFQALIFRLWDLVPLKKLASLLKTDDKTIETLARDMGLKEQDNTSLWRDRGYISILRHVWNILPYSQICYLLDWTEERLDYILKEDDFLFVKLGGWDIKKNDCEELVYRPLTEGEKKETLYIKEVMQKYIAPLKSKGAIAPFDFFNKKYESIKLKAKYDVNVDFSWGIYCEAEGVEDYLKDFTLEIKEKYSLALSGNEKYIHIKMDIKSDDEEYHEIHISDDKILINAAKPLGVMRALYFVLDLAGSAGSFSFEKKVYKRKTKIKTRFIYSFCGLYGDVLDKDSEISFPDELIKEYARQGINGVWIQGVFYKIAPYPFDMSKCTGWEERLERLDTMTRRLGKYGIKVYMYINEPRNMPDEFFKDKPGLRGTPQQNGNTCLCSSNEKTHKYLKDTIKTIIKNAPLLGGFINISQGENTVLCYSRGIESFNEAREKNLAYNHCPHCAKRKAYEVVGGILKTMADAAYEVNKDIKFFAYGWGWRRHLGAETEKLLETLPKNVIVLQVSESEMEFVRGGVKNKVMDYSLSIVGPGESAKELWKSAKENGLEVAAKVQINNSWECSTAPFLPVYENVAEHMRNLRKEGIEHIMLSWTLGGYMSDNIKIASAYFFDDSTGEDAYDSILKRTYGGYAETVKKAVHRFCEGFREYPFDCDHIYNGPSNAGAANLIYPKPTGMSATMTCYPYDDLKSWCGKVYTPEILKEQYKKLCCKWEEGLKILEDMPLLEFKDMAVYGYTLFKASLNQITYYMLRGSGEDLSRLTENERDLALKAYEIMLRNSAVGYEAANHYYVTRSSLMEKVINCEYILRGGKNDN